MSNGIDMSRLPLPAVLEEISYEQLLQAFLDRFVAAWDEERVKDPTLPAYDVAALLTDPIVIAGEAWHYLRMLDRQRVNDVIKAVLAPLAKGADLDNVVARQGVQRLVIVPAAEGQPAIMESDASLLQRYFDAMEIASAGSAARYLYEARTSWPQSDDRTLGLWHARVNGYAVHGRRGDTDVVIIGPFGRPASDEEKALVRAAVTHPSVQPEAVAVTVLDATRAEYTVEFVIEVGQGPDPELVRQEATARITRAAETRMVIGGEVPAGYLAGMAYGDSIILVRDLAPVVIEPAPYTVPVMTSCSVVVEVRT